MRRAAVPALLLAASLTPMLELKAEPAAVNDTRLEPVPFTALTGWNEDDHGAAPGLGRADDLGDEL